MVSCDFERPIWAAISAVIPQAKVIWNFIQGSNEFELRIKIQTTDNVVHILIRKILIFYLFIWNKMFLAGLPEPGFFAGAGAEIFTRFRLWLVQILF